MLHGRQLRLLRAHRSGVFKPVRYIIVVPVLVRGAAVAGGTLRLAPLLAAARAAGVGGKRVPDRKTARTALPAAPAVRPPAAHRAEDGHRSFPVASLRRALPQPYAL